MLAVTVGGVTRSAFRLAALAGAAVPGLLPVSVQQVRPRAGARYQVAFVADTQGRHWTVRLPMDAVAAAEQDARVDLLRLLAHRISVAIPEPAGFAAVPGGARAMVYPRLTGRQVDFSGLTPGPGLAAQIGRTIAAVHNVDRRLYDEAQLPSYDAESTRHRHLATLDRSAATRKVPAPLLARWERVLDDVSLWRFAPTPLHGRMESHQVLAGFSGDDAISGTVEAIVSWDRAHIGDPAEDFAALTTSAPADAVDSALEAYAVARTEEPDPRLEERARLVAELRVLDDLLVAVAADSHEGLRRVEEALAALSAAAQDSEPEAAPVTVEFEPKAPDDRLYRSIGGETGDQTLDPALDVIHPPHALADQTTPVAPGRTGGFAGATAAGQAPERPGKHSTEDSPGQADQPDVQSGPQR